MKYFRQTASRSILFVILTLLFISAANAQVKKPNSLNASIDGHLKSSGLDYKKPNEIAWIVNYENETILVGAQDDFFLAGVVVAQKGQFRETAESLSEILKLVHEIDFVKIGLDNDGDLFVRTERKGNTMEKQEFVDYIGIVSRAAKTVRTRLQPYMVKK